MMPGQPRRHCLGRAVEVGVDRLLSAAFRDPELQLDSFCYIIWQQTI